MSTLAHPSGPTWVAAHRTVVVALMAALLAVLVAASLTVLLSRDPTPVVDTPAVQTPADTGSGYDVCRPRPAPLPQPC